MSSCFRRLYSSFTINATYKTLAEAGGARYRYPPSSLPFGLDLVQRLDMIVEEKEIDTFYRIKYACRNIVEFVCQWATFDIFFQRPRTSSRSSTSISMTRMKPDGLPVSTVQVIRDTELRRTGLY